MPAGPVPPIRGIHHITAVAGDAQANLDFHVGILGLRLVKSTVNFDDPATYHFYFADHAGSPGTVLTYFPHGPLRRHRPGTGEVSAIGLAIGEASIGWWIDRLRRLDIRHAAPVTRFDESVIALEDPDGTRLELIAGGAEAPIPVDAGSALPPAHAIRGFHSATLTVAAPGPTAHLLEAIMGMRAVSAEADRTRFVGAADAAAPGRTIDLRAAPDLPRARPGAGGVHHIAFRVPDDDALARWHQALPDAGHITTPIVDRRYFRSLYFREHGGVLFEFATDGPGFTRDEPLDALGSGLRLPEWLEARREAIERGLPAIARPQPRL